MMHEPSIAPAYELFNGERIADLHIAAAQAHAGRREEAARPSLVLRTRTSLAHGLMSLGHTVAGGRA